jgi:hypothetical protein
MSEETANQPDHRKLEKQHTAETIQLRTARYGHADIQGVCHSRCQEVIKKAFLQQKITHLPQVQFYQYHDENREKQIPEQEKPDMGRSRRAVEEAEIPGKTGDVGIHNKNSADQTDQH